MSADKKFNLFILYRCNAYQQYIFTDKHNKACRYTLK